MPGAGAGREKNEPAVGVEGVPGREGMMTKLEVELEMDVVGEEATELEVEAVLVVGDIGCGTTSG